MNAGRPQGRPITLANPISERVGFPHQQTESDGTACHLAAKDLLRS